MPEATHRAGVVAILGRPNAGKSTLLNGLLGEKLAIVTPKPQTTRSRILGVLSLPDAQLLLHDTPGWHAGQGRLGTAMNEAVEAAADDCDVALVLIGPREHWSEDHAALAKRVAARGAAVIGVATQCDRPAAARRERPPGLDAWHRISARTGDGVEALLRDVAGRLPASPPLYDPGMLSDRPLRWLAAELVREAAFEALSQELPYSVAVEIDEFDESRPDLARIRARLLVERRSQKAIAVGRGGAVIKRIGSRAREQIERLVGTRVFLDLRVAVEPKWAHKPKRLKALGYS